jgi:phosphoenolpyruvate synthase/pyruvate phosphate dikinase
LLAELYDVLTEKTPLSEEIVRSRWELVILHRQECLWESTSAEKIAALLHQADGRPESGVITGICASSGVVKGYVKHVHNFQDATTINSANILVAMGTDFDMMEGICNCAGVITEEGGLLSHASVITRELGKPCLINVQQVFSRLPEGAYVELNATTGHVTLLSYPKPAKITYPVIPLQKLNDWRQSGHKAYRLCQAAAMGFPTVPGIVLPVGLRSETLSEDLGLHILEVLRAEGAATEKLLIRSSSPLEDSLERSAAGIFTSAVTSSNVTSLLVAIKRVLDAGKSPQVRKYFNIEIAPLAVLVQPYIKQDWGGVAFSRDPLTGDSCVIVEASREGAHAVVEGRPQAQQAFQHSQLEGIDEKNRNNLLIAKPDIILQYAAQTAYQLEKRFNGPVDIEWGLSEENFFIFQIRPITTLPEQGTP